MSVEPEAGKTRTEQIVATLRQSIVRGDMKPGDRLPSWNALESSFEVTRTTLSRVFTQLRDDGFVYSSTKKGTFVVDKPPHLFRHGLVFPEKRELPEFNRFWQTLASTAERYRDKTGNRFETFYGVHTNLENDEHNRLLSDVANDRLASLTVVGHPQAVSPYVWKRAPLPKVGIWNRHPEWPGPSIYIDRQDFVERSLDHLLRHGRRRVAVLTNPTEPLNEFAAAAEKRGIYHPPHWRLLAPANYPQSVRPIVNLLMSLNPKDRPDALIVADDNLVADTTAVLAELPPGDRPEVLAHCTWPKPVVTPYPVTYLGYDARQVLRYTVDLSAELLRSRPGALKNRHVSIPSLFEDELER